MESEPRFQKEIDRREAETVGNGRTLSWVKCTWRHKGKWAMPENQVSNNLKLHPPTLRENYKIPNLKWKAFFFASVDREQGLKLRVWKCF